jgi:hypothetical protein
MRVGRRTVLRGATALAAFSLAGCRAPSLLGPPPTVAPAAPPTRVALVYDDRTSVSSKEAQQTLLQQAVEAVATAGRVALDRQVTLVPIVQPPLGTPVPAGSDLELQALEAALGGQGGEAPPDLLVFGDYLFSGASPFKIRAMAKGLLRPLDDLAASSAAALSAYYPGALATGRWVGKLYALPLAISVGMVLYDPALFQQAGLQPPDASWNWQRMLDASVQLTRPPGQYAWGLLPDLSVFLWQNGADILSPDGQRCILDQPPAIEAAAFYGDLFTRSKVVTPQATGFSQDGGHLTVGGGRAAMVFLEMGGGSTTPPLRAAEPFRGTARATYLVVQQAFAMAARTVDPHQAYAAMTALAAEIEPRSDLPPKPSLVSQPSPSPGATPGGDFALAVQRAAGYGRALAMEPDIFGPFRQSLVQPLQQGSATADVACRQATKEINAALHARAVTPGPV